MSASKRASVSMCVVRFPLSGLKAPDSGRLGRAKSVFIYLLFFFFHIIIIIITNKDDSIVISFCKWRSRFWNLLQHVSRRIPPRIHLVLMHPSAFVFMINNSTCGIFLFFFCFSFLTPFTLVSMLGYIRSDSTKKLNLCLPTSIIYSFFLPPALSRCLTALP